MKKAHDSLRRGVATIPIILILGILVVAIGVGITSLALSESLMSQGSYNSTRALSFAESGARDALERIARNKNYSCTATDCYSIDMTPGGCSGGAACARISVSSGIGSAADLKIIRSSGQAGVNIRKLQVSVLLDASQYGEIASTTWIELTN